MCIALPIHRVALALWLLLLAGCLATPPAQPPVVSTSERRSNYRATLTAAVVLAPAGEGDARRGPGSDTRTASAQLDAAVQRRLREVGVPTLVLADAEGLHGRGAGRAAQRHGASHFMHISMPTVVAGRTAVQVELRDTLTRTLVWRYAGELDTATHRPAAQQVADRMADALIHRLREDGLLAR